MGLTALSQRVAQFLKDTPSLAKTFILTGGGPGMMEAANRGAFEVDPAKSIGMGISLPFEPSLNKYVSPELAFEFHYFMTRKFWMVYMCRALIVAPGGVGTMDELFEVMTLQQTGKITHRFPIVLFGESFWRRAVAWDFLVEAGTIAQADVDALFFTDSVDEAFEYIKARLTDQLEHGACGPPEKKAKK